MFWIMTSKRFFLDKFFTLEVARRHARYFLHDLRAKNDLSRVFILDEENDTYEEVFI